MLDTPPMMCAEPEGYSFPVFLQGTGSSSPPTRLGRNNYAVTRTSTGVYLITFNDDPGPTFLGGAFGFHDATASNVLGWSVAYGAYTPPAGSALATLAFTVGNASNAAAELPSTTKLKLAIEFKRLSRDE